MAKSCNEHDKIISKLEGDKYKLGIELELAMRRLQEKEEELSKSKLNVNLNTGVTEIVKEVIVEKPV